jgi:sugar lactone lactonase YvrE
MWGGAANAGFFNALTTNDGWTPDFMHPEATWLKLKAFARAVVAMAACAAPGLAQPTITVPPTSQTGLAGSNVTFSVTVTGTGPFTYQWQFNGTNLPNNVITTIAGSGSTGFSGDGGPATNARLYNAQGMVLDANGNLYIADSGNNRVRRVDGKGVITTVAGNGSPRYAGDGGAATNACLYAPIGVALDGSGNLYIADSFNVRVRKVNTDGIITTVAGGGSGGDGGPATNASLNAPEGVALDAFGNLYIATLGNRVRAVSTNGIITTVAGNGTGGFSGDGGAATNANLNQPDGVSVSGSGNLYIADYYNSRIRMVNTNGVIMTVAGNGTSGYSGDGGAATNAHLYFPSDVTFDMLGNLFIADYNNNRIRKVDTNGIITTVAGGGSGGDGGAATNASLANPSHVAFDASGNLYISQSGCIRKVLAYASYPTLKLNNLTTNNAGNYTVVVTGASGSVTSSVAVLAIDTITTQPVSQTVLNGSDATFSVAAASTAPFGYAWYFNGALLNPDATNATLTLRHVTTNDAGSYTVVITNLYGNVTSAVATLAVVFPPSILSQPAGQTVWVGSNAAFSVTAGGTGPFNYQWQLNGSNVVNHIIATVAGNGSAAYAGDGGAATSASLNYPYGVAMDSSGNLYVADTGNNRIRRVDANGVITTVAGNGSGGYSGDGASATNASLNSPAGVGLDASGSLYVADSSNNRVRRVYADGIITTAAGGGSGGSGTVATSAMLSWPYGVALSAGNQLYIADYGDTLVRRVDTNGILWAFAGNGNYGFSGDGGSATSASLYRPTGAALDAFGNLYIADNYNHRIRKVATNGVIVTVAGSGIAGYYGDGGLATAAELNNPSGVALDTFGNLYIADSGNNRIREVGTNNIIATIAGVGTAGFAGDGGAATSASLDLPSGVALDACGNLYIADRNNHRIRKVEESPTLVLSQVAAGAVGNYTVVITSPWGCVTSSVAALTLDGPPTIVTPPASQAVSAGSNAAFQVTLEGTPPFDFAWYSNGTNLIADGTNAWLELDDVTTNDAGSYTIVITNQYGSVTSSIAVLTVTLPPAIVVQPSAPPVVLVGDNVLLSVAVAGTGPFSYQWQWNGTNLPNNLITTVAGNGTPGSSGDGGAAVNAMLNDPYGEALDVWGNMYISDSYNQSIRKVDTHGIITTVATGFVKPLGLAMDQSGNLYVADYNGFRVCRVGSDGTVSTVAGNGIQGFSGDGGAATNASLSAMTVAVDAAGNLFLADALNARVRKVDTRGNIMTVAGGGSGGDGGPATSARFGFVSGVKLDPAGNLYIVDCEYCFLRKVDTRGIISTVAGKGPGVFGSFSGDGGMATNAFLSWPTDVAVDALGNLYLADSWNNRVRRVDTNGIITTVAGNGGTGYSGDGGAATNASLNNPQGLGFDSSGNLYIADSGHACIREVALAGSPTRTLNTVTTSNSGDYNVVITTPWGSITSSVATVTVQIRPSIAGTVLNADGSLTLNCAGTPNSTNRVWVATSLAPPVVWWAASTNVAGADGTWQFTDTDTAGYPARFYCLSMP